MSNIIAATALAVYVVGAFLTFGYVHNSFDCRADEEYRCLANRSVAPMAGIGWPVYWAGKASIAITKPREAE